MTAYQQDRDLLRFHYHRPREIWENLKDLDLPRRTFSSELSQVPTVQHFITEDEIDAAMTGGSSFAGGKGRIYAFFMANHTDKEKVRFLKDEYGIGGRSHALSGATHSGEDHDGKGPVSYTHLYKVKVFFDHSSGLTAEDRLKRIIQAEARCV